MSSQSSTSSLESLNESSTTKYGLTCTNQLFRTKIIFVTTQQRDKYGSNSDKELNTRTVLEIQTGVYVVTVARWKHQQKVFVVIIVTRKNFFSCDYVVMKCWKSLTRDLTVYITMFISFLV